ncbi:MAG: hypothetical protein RRZ73_06080 [Oscillospiraceae bacterium]
MKKSFSKKLIIVGMMVATIAAGSVIGFAHGGGHGKNVQVETTYVCPNGNQTCVNNGVCLNNGKCADLENCPTGGVPKHDGTGKRYGHSCGRYYSFRF